MADNFDAYSAYYDLFYQDKSYDQEVDWLVQRLRLFAPDAHTLLDGGCGTGAYTERFEQKGYQAQGIDLSPAMIERAQQQGSASYEVGDVRSYRAAQPVDVVTLLFHVMSYQTSDADVLATLDSCNANLKPGGLLCFDVWHKDAVLAQQPERRTKEMSDGSTHATRRATPEHHPELNRVDVHYDITIETTGETTRFKEVHPMRYFVPAEIRDFLGQTDFELLEAAELITGATPSPNTWGICYFARKLA